MKTLQVLIGFVGTILLLSTCVTTATAGAKHAQAKPKADLSRFSLTEIENELFYREAIDENGHYFTRQELTARHKVLTTQQIARLVLPSVVRLTVIDVHGEATVQGSGFVVGKNMIATNVHVIKGAHAVTANFQNGRSVVVTGLVTQDTPLDIAIVYADTTGVRPLIFALDPAHVGDPVVAVGSPRGLEGSISTGIISGLREQNGSRVVQTTAPISPGSSGGALLDVYGQVLGITSFYYVDGQNLNFAYASEYLRRIRPYRAASVYTWKQGEDWDKNLAAAPLNPTAASPVNAASKSVYTSKPLTGLKGVWVCISDIDPDAQKEGVDSNQIKIEVELRLRKAGILVFEERYSEGNDSMAELYVDVNTLRKDTGNYAIAINLKLKEMVSLLRYAQTTYLASGTTWTTGRFGGVDKDRLVNVLGTTINEEVDTFANDYLAQNPK